MRRAIVVIVILIALGSVANVGVCLSCATWARLGAFDPLLLAKLRREFYQRDTPDQQHFVDMAYPGTGTQFMLVAIESPHVKRDAINGPYPMVAQVRSGWPCMAMEGRLDCDASRSPKPLPAKPSWAVVTSRPPLTGNRFAMPVMLPLKPMWPGFAVNTVLFAIGVAAVIGIRLGLRYAYRLLRSCCGWCGYPTGESRYCTECGRRVRSRRPAV